MFRWFKRRGSDGCRIEEAYRLGVRDGRVFQDTLRRLGEAEADASLPERDVGHSLRLVEPPDKKRQVDG